MKPSISVILLLLCTNFSFAQAPVTSWATIEVDGKLVATPKADLSIGSEDIRTTSVILDGKKFVFALKSSASTAEKGIKYSVAVSLTDTGKYEFGYAESSVASTLKPIAFTIPINGANYNAIVHLDKK